MAAMVVDDDSGAQRILQPIEFPFIENQIVAVGLRVVVAVGAQSIGDDVETIGSNQGRAGRLRAALEVVRSEDSCKVIGEGFCAQITLNVLERVAHSRRMLRIDDYSGLRIQIPDKEHVDQLQAICQCDRLREFGVGLERGGGRAEYEILIQLQSVRGAVKIGNLRVEATTKKIHAHLDRD